MTIPMRQRNNSQMMAYLILADTHSEIKTVIKITIKIRIEKRVEINTKAKTKSKVLFINYDAAKILFNVSKY